MNLTILTILNYDEKLRLHSSSSHFFISPENYLINLNFKIIPEFELEF